MKTESKLQKLKDYIKLFFPEKTKEGKDIDLSNFSFALANNYNNNDILADSKLFGKDNHKEDFYTLNILKELAEQDKHLIGTGADVWATPNLLLNKPDIKASSGYVSWLTSLFVDIDGIEGIKDADKALDKLYTACDRAGIKRPHIVNHTSTNPTVHLQAFWLIDPVYTKTYDYDINERNKNWWKDSQRAITQALKESDPDLKLDSSVNDIAKYMRLPYTYNQKTGEEVKILEINNTDDRYLLQDKWLSDLVEEYIFNRNNNSKSYIKANTDSLLEHEQFKVLAQGFPRTQRYFSHYALAKACLGDGLSLNQAKEKLIEVNNLCKPPERESKVLDIAERAYNDDKGIDIGKVAELANSAINKDKFKPDPSVLKLFNIDTVNSNPSDNKEKNNKLDKIVNKIKKLYNYGHKELLSQKQLSKIFNINYNTLKNYFKKAIKKLREQGIYLVYIVKKQNYVFMNFSEWVSYVLSKVNNNSKNDKITINYSKKSFPQPLYIFSLYSIKWAFGFVGGIRGSPI